MTLSKNTQRALSGFVDALLTELVMRSAASGSNAKTVRPLGQKRDPKEIDAVTEKLLAYIRKHPGERIEPIGKALGVPTKDLLIPVRRLIAAKHVKTRGRVRATTYSAR